jgi:O-antigen ligase
MTSKLFQPIVFLFVFSGALKSNFLVIPLNEIIDVGLLLGAITLMIIGLNISYKPRLSLSGEVKTFLLYFTQFYLVCLISFALTYSGNPDALKKALQFFTAVPIYLLATIFFYSSNDGLKNFWYFALAFSLFIILSKAFEVFTGKLIMVGALEGYQWLTMVSFLGLVSCLRLLDSSKNIWHKISLYLCFLTLLAGLFLGGARQNVLALMFIYGFLAYKKYFHAMALSLILTLIAKLVFLVVAIYMGLQVYIALEVEIRGVERISFFVMELRYFDVGGILVESGRLIPFMDGLNMFVENFIAGVGFGNYSSYAVADHLSHPHNFIIEILAELGIIGVISVIPVLLPLMFMVYSADQKNRSGLYFVALTSGFFITMMVSGDMGTSRVFWFFYILTMIDFSFYRKYKKAEIYAV